MNKAIDLYAQLSDERKQVFAEKVYDMIMREQETERAKARVADIQGTQPEREPVGDDNVK